MVTKRTKDNESTNEVTNKGDGTISRIDPALLAVTGSISLAGHSQPHGLIVDGRACPASIDEQLGDRVDRYVRHAGDRPHGGAFAEHREDLNTLMKGQPIHTERYAKALSHFKSFSH